MNNIRPSIEELERITEIHQSDQNSLARFFKSGGFRRTVRSVYKSPILTWEDGLFAYIHEKHFCIGTISPEIAREIVEGEKTARCQHI